MIVPLVLFLISFGGVAISLAMPNMSDMLLIAGPACIASLYLLARAWLAARQSTSVIEPKWIVVDGSNVMHWADDTPRIEPLREVLGYLKSLGFTAGVVFDANVGYLIRGKYQHDRALGKLLGLPQDRVIVVDKGTPADPTILKAARNLNTCVVTNDRYRDWTDQYPEVCRSGFLIRGDYRKGRLWLDLDHPKAAQSANILQQTAMH